ncbi:MAG: hypothetical protein JNL67_09465 [Planctomycetaceae bacterium]|nr:hypothetical protein [Planctomycetaceae bacterium]
MSTILEDQISNEVGRDEHRSEAEFDRDCNSTFDAVASPDDLKSPSLSSSAKSFRAELPWWHPTSRLDWFSKYTIRSVVLMLSFLAFGLVVSSLLLSW